jgi:uncharacterized membrane protein
MTGLMHVVAAVLTLLIGGVQLVQPKGTRTHRRRGWVYVALLLVLNASALTIYRETGRWNHFHSLAVASLLTLLVGLGAFAAGRQRGWVIHAYAMAGSYLGVILAGLFQLATHLPARSLALALTTAIAVPLGVWLLAVRTPREIREAARPIGACAVRGASP